MIPLQEKDRVQLWETPFRPISVTWMCVCVCESNSRHSWIKRCPKLLNLESVDKFL